MRVLADALIDWYGHGAATALDAYSTRVPAPRLARGALLVVDDVDAAPRPAPTRSTCKLQLSQLRYVTTSTAAATSLAENYVGLDAACEPRRGHDTR